MPSNAASVARRVRLFRDNTLSPQALSDNLAKFARQKRDELIRTGQAPASYITLVDGQKGVVEERVRPTGKIVYLFNTLGLAAVFALAFCRARSPVRSGDFQGAWFLAVNGQRFVGDLNDIPFNAELMVTNPLPYARKVEVGHMRMSVPHHIIEDCRTAVLKAFPSLKADNQFVLIKASQGGGYILRGHFRRGFRQHSRVSLRPDVFRGESMTYPALIISAR